MIRIAIGAFIGGAGSVAAVSAGGPEGVVIALATGIMCFLVGTL